MSNRIKQLRESHDMKQIDLAKLLNVSQGTLSNWERGIHDPDHEALIWIADRFGVSTDYILGLTENPLTTRSKKKPPAEAEGDIEAMVESILSELTGAEGDTLMLDGKPTSAKALEYLRESIRANIEHAKRLNEQENG